MSLKKIILAYTAFLIGMFLITALSHKTFVPIELQEMRGFVPSNSELKTTYSKFYDSHRDADNYFYHTKRVSETFKYGIEGSTNYSLDTMLGYPIGPEIENTSGIGDLITKALLYCCTNDSYKASLISSDLTLVLWSIISFCTLILVGVYLGFSNKLSSVLAIICNPAFFAYSFEGTLMSIVGSQLVFLSILLIKNKNFYGYLFAFFGSYTIFNSNDYHFFLYFPITLLVFTPYIIKILQIKNSIYLFILIGIPFLMNIDKFIWINDLLSSSLQKTDLETLLIKRSYHPLLISGLIELPLMKMIGTQIPYENLRDLISFLFPTTAILIGYVVGILGLVSIYDLKNRYVSIPIILLILYWVGPFHFILSLISDTYQAETSIRINLILYMILSTLALYLINSKAVLKYKKFLIKASAIILIVCIAQFLLISIYDLVRGIGVIWFSGITQIASIILFLVFLNRNQKRYIFIAILLLPISNAFFFNGMRTFQSHDYRDLIEMNSVLNGQFKTRDVAMLISSKNAKSSMHANALMQAKVRTIQAYLKPSPELYSRLYWQQYFSYDADFDQSMVEENIIEQVKYMDMTGPTIINKNELSLETENFMLLSGVNKIITTDEITLDTSKYSMVFTGYGINIFEPNILPRWIYGSCTIININNVSGLLKEAGLKVDINERNRIFSQENKSNIYCKSKPKVSNIRINKNSSEIIFNISGAGIVFLNLSFNKNLEAYNNQTNKKLEIIRCNIAFSCVKADKINGIDEIRIRYERPSLMKLFDLYRS
jgi:hypothetical protein